MRTHAAAGLSLLLLVAACGGGLSKQELVAEGDAICKRINTRMAKEPDPKTTKDLQRLADRTIELSDPAIEDMEELAPPSELEADFKKFLASLKRQRNLTKKLGAAAGEDDTAQVQELLGEAQKAQDEYRRLTGKIGFKECGGGV
jgi:hypothetical protein